MLLAVSKDADRIDAAFKNSIYKGRGIREMLFSSIVFLFTFLPAVVILYYLLPVRFRNPCFAAASLVFMHGGTGISISDAVIHIV